MLMIVQSLVVGIAAAVGAFIFYSMTGPGKRLVEPGGRLQATIVVGVIATIMSVVVRLLA